MHERKRWQFGFLEDCWETLDVLTETFGSEQACALLLARPCLTVLSDTS